MATLEQLERALVNADKAGDMDAARKLAAAVTQARAQVATSSGAIVPGDERAEVLAPPKQATIGEKLIGAGEAALTLGTGVVGGSLGMIGGTLKGLAEQILSGQFGTPEAANMVEQSAVKGMQAMTYEPRTQAGRDALQPIAEAAQSLIPLAGLAPQVAALGNAARPAAAAAVDVAKAAVPTVKTAAKAATTLPRRALERLSNPEPTPAPGTMGSVGAAGTDMAAQRIALAESLPVPLQLTKGQASRDPAQLKFEVETAKLPAEGSPIRARLIQQNEQILDNFDHWIDQTGAQAQTLRATGQAVDSALVRQAATDKAKVNAAYRKADASPESQALVDPARVAQIGEGDSAIASTPFAWINQQPSGLQTTGLLDYARQSAVKLGIADLQDGQLIPRPATIKQMETWRKEIGGATGYEAPEIRQSTIIKALIDGQTEPVAGPLYRQARATRTRFAQNYEDRAVISRLLNNKRGTGDRQVALEDVFDHSVLKGSLDDVRNVRRVLHRSGEQGQQAWRELQGATARWIQGRAERNSATDSAGNRVVSVDGLDKAIRELDADGKLDFVFGKKGAQQMRDIRDLAQVAKTVPPEAAINASNTAMTLLAAFADIGGASMTGVPLPAATGFKLIRKYIKDRALSKRIEEALGERNQ